MADAGHSASPTLPKHIRVTLVTPERSLVDETVDELQIPGADGYLGVLPGHAPLFTALKVGEFGYKRDGRWTWLSVASGFAEILPDQVRILAETAERASEIDIDRAKRAKDRAEKRLRGAEVELDYERASIALQRALSRLQVSNRMGGSAN